MIGIAWLAMALAAEEAQPDFKDPKVRQETQLRILAALVEKGEVQPAMYLVKELRAEGVAAPGLDLAQAWAMSVTGLGGEALSLLEESSRRWPREGEGRGPRSGWRTPTPGACRSRWRPTGGRRG